MPVTNVGNSNPLGPLDFWALMKPTVTIDGVALTIPILGNVVVASLPAGATIVRAIAMLKFRVIENTNVAINQLDGSTVANTSQVIQVKKAGGAWLDAIQFTTTQFRIPATTRESGDVIIGQDNVVAQVNANATYEFQWLLAKALLVDLQMKDIQTGLRIWYSV